MGTLYVVGTPIGNLEDITLRALRVLGEVGLIAAEDTRTTKVLLRHYSIDTPLSSFHEHNTRTKVPLLIETLKTKDVALVSEAGMPGISDPGRELVMGALRAGVPVVPVPGPSAVTTALAVSTVAGKGALFVGFLPRRKGERRRLLESIKTQPFAIVAFEAPHRLLSSLSDALAVLGDREMVVCKEMTKLYEELFQGTVTQAMAHFVEPKGEFTLVLSGISGKEVSWDPAWAEDELRRLRGEGLKARDAVATVVQATGGPRREVYRLWLETGKR